ncbi:uncharacterized protein AC631_00860 [Debaryomyces fabryi]|uniref:Uncharacterized protein n=1 Tax=Debaryomyces fabryi TaxID=58627 RepID=A0A0V1Q590_9ASCO|nr:uncharacterized protein AC631_00860 [Debaryomyces fabryi]KSA03375.1 hypothetical protein AC631_00860 [Debaryomyces fabryi]CUM49961.1 unnamed protein product [Debaryomyces fabryi]
MVKYFDPSTAPYLNPTIDRRVAFITGGNSGIGWFTILHLYLHGYVVYIAGRTESKVRKAIEDIKGEAEKRVSEYTKEEQNSRSLGSLDYVYLDLLDLSTVEAAADSFSKKEPELHILINNAGIMGVPYEETKDGYEVQYQVNFASHFLLTFKLMPLIKKVALKGSIQPRIIQLTSEGHRASYRYFRPDENLNRFPNFLYTWYRYGAAKLASIQFMNLLGRENPDILCASVHPGIIFDTELFNYWKKLPILGYLSSASMYTISPLIGVRIEEGSLSTLKVALDPTVNLLEDSGKYYVTGGYESSASKVAQNEKDAITTWNWNLNYMNKLGFSIDAPKF